MLPLVLEGWRQLCAEEVGLGSQIDEEVNPRAYQIEASKSVFLYRMEFVFILVMV